jgi:hypothetical protein
MRISPAQNLRRNLLRRESRKWNDTVRDRLAVVVKAVIRICSTESNSERLDLLAEWILSACLAC